MKVSNQTQPILPSPSLLLFVFSSSPVAIEVLSVTDDKLLIFIIIIIIHCLE